MDAHLLKLRRECYKAAGEYHKIMGLWFAAQSLPAPTEGVADILPQYSEAAENYGDALEALMSYLITLKSTNTIEEEKDRTQKLKEILYRELRLIL